MSTLHEENVNSRDSEEEHDSDHQIHVKENVEVSSKKAIKDDCKSKLPSSTSLNELGGNSQALKLGTASPSIVSSGYGSQAASSSNLSR